MFKKYKAIIAKLERLLFFQGLMMNDLKRMHMLDRDSRKCQECYKDFPCPTLKIINRTTLDLAKKIDG